MEFLSFADEFHEKRGPGRGSPENRAPQLEKSTGFRKACIFSPKKVFGTNRKSRRMPRNSLPPLEGVFMSASSGFQTVKAWQIRFFFCLETLNPKPVQFRLAHSLTGRHGFGPVELRVQFRVRSSQLGQSRRGVCVQVGWMKTRRTGRTQQRDSIQMHPRV